DANTISLSSTQGGEGQGEEAFMMQSKTHRLADWHFREAPHPGPLPAKSRGEGDRITSRAVLSTCFSLRLTLTFAVVAAATLAPLPNTNAAATETNSAISVALTRALHEPDLDKRLEQISDVGMKLSLSEIPDALKAADSLKELREQMVLKQTTLSRWSEL